MSACLFQRLGGAAGLAAITDDALDRHAANPRRAARFSDQDLPHLKALSERFLTARTGGQQRDDAGDTPATHAGMRFSDAEMAAVVNDLAVALLEQGVAAAEIGEVINLFQSPHPEPPTHRCVSPGAAAGNDSGTDPA